MDTSSSSSSSNRSRSSGSGNDSVNSYDQTNIAPVSDASNRKQDRSINNKQRASIAVKQMDVVHDRASIVVEEDRISNLPDEIVLHILSFLDMKYAIQTTALSKRWKHIWTSIPHLNLNSRTFCCLPKFVKLVNEVLSHRNHRIEVSGVELSFRGATTEFAAVLTSIVNYAYSYNVRKLTIEWFRLNDEVFEFPQRLFSSHTLKHLVLATHFFNGSKLSLPKSAWDFPALETLNLSNRRLSDGGDESLNLFSKCVNLKDLTLHHCAMFGLDIFNVCAPRLSSLAITDPLEFPRDFNVVAPQLKSLTASVMDVFSNFLPLSVEDMDSLEKVNLSMRPSICEKERYAPKLLNLFQTLCSAKFLILDNGIIKVLSAYRDRLSYQPCPFNNLRWLKQKDRTQRIPTQVRNYFLESSPTATFIVDLPQVPHKSSREEELDKGIVAKKVSKIFYAFTLLYMYEDNNDGLCFSYLCVFVCILCPMALSSSTKQLSHKASPFNKLKCLNEKDRIPRTPVEVINQLVKSSPSATFKKDLPQVFT